MENSLYLIGTLFILAIVFGFYNMALDWVENKYGSKKKDDIKILVFALIFLFIIGMSAYALISPGHSGGSVREGDCSLPFPLCP